MPIRKFRSVEEMERPCWREPGDASLYRSIRQIWEFGRSTNRLRFPAGVHRHRSIQDLDEQSERWNAANFRRRQTERW